MKSYEVVFVIDFLGRSRAESAATHRAEKDEWIPQSHVLQYGVEDPETLLKSAVEWRLLPPVREKALQPLEGTLPPQHQGLIP